MPQVEVNIQIGGEINLHKMPKVEVTNQTDGEINALTDASSRR